MNLIRLSWFVWAVAVVGLSAGCGRAPSSQEQLADALTRAEQEAAQAAKTLPPPPAAGDPVPLKP